MKTIHFTFHGVTHQNEHEFWRGTKKECLDILEDRGKTCHPYYQWKQAKVLRVKNDLSTTCVAAHYSSESEPPLELTRNHRSTKPLKSLTKDMQFMEGGE